MQFSTREAVEHLTRRGASVVKATVALARALRTGEAIASALFDRWWESDREREEQRRATASVMGIQASATSQQSLSPYPAFHKSVPLPTPRQEDIPRGRWRNWPAGDHEGFGEVELKDGGYYRANWLTGEFYSEHRHRQSLIASSRVLLCDREDGWIVMRLRCVMIDALAVEALGRQMTDSTRVACKNLPRKSDEEIIALMVPLTTQTDPRRLRQREVFKLVRKTEGYEGTTDEAMLALWPKAQGRRVGRPLKKLTDVR